MDFQKVMETIGKASSSTLLYAALVLIVGFIVARQVVKVLKRVLEKTKIDPSLHVFFCTAAKTLVYVLTVMIAASVLGIPISSIIALFSVVGIALTLSVQNMLTSLIGGMTIMASKLFKHDDYICLAGTEGKVVGVNFLYTRIKSPDGKSIVLPNSVVITSTLTNCTCNNTRRIELKVGAAYHNTPTEVREAIMLAISRVPGLFSEPKPMIYLESYDDSCITYLVHCWCPASEFFRLKHELNEGLYNAFAERNIEFTYPHLNVHMKAGDD